MMYFINFCILFLVACFIAPYYTFFLFSSLFFYGNRLSSLQLQTVFLIFPYIPLFPLIFYHAFLFSKIHCKLQLYILNVIFLFLRSTSRLILNYCNFCVILVYLGYFYSIRSLLIIYIFYSSTLLKLPVLAAAPDILTILLIIYLFPYVLFI